VQDLHLSDVHDCESYATAVGRWQFWHNLVVFIFLKVALF